MFDWNDQDQVVDTIWGELTETEDHIVPYPKSSEENTLIAFGDYNKKQSNEETSTVKRFSEHKSGDKSDLPGSNQENDSTLNDNTEISVTRLDMDSWPDLPSLNSGLGGGYDDANYQDSMATELINNFSEAPNLNKMGVHINAEPEMFNDHEDKESDSFLHCDWSNIGDFDDLDRIFSSNDSIFGHEIVGNTEEFLPASSDMISSTEQSTLIPDMPVSQDHPSCRDSSSLQIDELSSGKLKLDTKTSDSTIKAEEEVGHKEFASSDYNEQNDCSPEKADTKKRQLHKSRKRTEESSKHSTLKSIKTTRRQSTNQKQQFSSSCMQDFSKTSCQAYQNSQKQASAVDGGQLGPSNRFMFSGYGYPSYPFAVIPTFQHIHSQSYHAKPVIDGSKAFSTSAKHSGSLNKPPEVPSRPSTMTPQEKIEKLRRRQQMQAMLAIQQQQQQLGSQINNEILTPRSCSPRKQTQESMSIAAVEDSTNNILQSDMNMHVPSDDNLKFSSMSDDQSIAEAIYYQLQHALEKLDIKIRICIRDSLFRLAQNAMERQSTADKSSTNKSNKDVDELPGNDETKGQGRAVKSQDAETGTNPIDRTVAQLLFHRSSESPARPVKDELQSSTMFNPASIASLNTNASASEEVQESIKEMEVQPSLK